MAKIRSYLIDPIDVNQNQEFEIILKVNEDCKVIFAIRRGRDDSVIFNNGKNNIEKDMNNGINTFNSSVSGAPGIVRIYATVKGSPQEEKHLEINLS